MFLVLDDVSNRICGSFLADFAQVARVAAVCKEWKSTMLRPDTWQDLNVSLATCVVPEALFVPLSRLFASVKTAVVNSEQEGAAAALRRPLKLDWTFVEDEDMWRQQIGTNRFLLSRRSLPSEAVVNLQWIGPLRGISMGLSTATTSAELQSIVTTRNPLMLPRFAALRVSLRRSDVIRPRWEYNGAPRSMLGQVYAHEHVTKQDGISSLQMSILQHDHQTEFKIGGQTVAQ
eukprot:11380890-Karenia_brevis.AAC.1